MAITPLLAPRNMVNISFSGRDYKEIIISMEEWIHGKNGMNGSVIAGLIPGTTIAQSQGALKTFEDWVKKSIGDLSQDAKTTSGNEQTLETAMNKMADKFQEINEDVANLDKEIKAISTDVDSKIATLSNSQKLALDSMSDKQKEAMQALTTQWQQELQNLKDNLVPKINALEALHKGVTPTIHKITKPIINRGTPLYNVDMSIAVDGTHTLRSVIPYKQNYWVRYWTEDKKTGIETEHIKQSVDNDDLHIFDDGGFLGIQPKTWPTDVRIIQIWPPSQPPLPSTGHTK